jgi:hypothetical protein
MLLVLLKPRPVIGVEVNLDFDPPPPALALIICGEFLVFLIRLVKSYNSFVEAFKLFFLLISLLLLKVSCYSASSS